MHKDLTAVVTVLLLSGCYISTGRSFVMQQDSSATADADIRDIVPDMEAEYDVTGDIVEVETAPPPCLYEFAGVRQLTEPDHQTNAPRIFWNGSEIGVVLFESGGSMPHPYVSHLNVAPDLSSQTALKMVGEESHGWGEPAWTGDAFGLCWFTDPGMVGRTAFKLIDRDGDPIGSRVDLDFEGRACVGLVYGDGRFLAAWRHEVWEGEEFFVDSRIRLLDGNGNPAAEPMDLAYGPYPGAAPSMAYTGSEFLVALAAANRIELTWIDAAGNVTRNESVTAEGAAHAVMAERDGTVALAWLTGERWARGLHMRVFDQNMAPLGEQFLVAEHGSGAAYPDLHALPDGWLLAWYQGPMEDASAMLLYLSTDGVPKQPRIVMKEGHNSGYGGPVLAPAGYDLFAGISYYTDDVAGWEQVHLLKFTCTPGSLNICAPQDAEVNVTCDDPVSLGWKWTGDSCIELFGCEEDCIGTDCGRLARTQWDCRSDRQFCFID